VPKLSGMSFLEFAVDEDSGRALGALIESLGFHYAGKHRSKKVTLLRQGDINLILNAEPNSPARAYFDERGPSICATGLRTDDPVRALNRATALQCARVDTALGPRELRIPAIRAPDGGAIYFVSVELGPNGPFDLNVSLSQRTRTARTVSAIGGGSVHHIALGCTDVVATVAKLRANGVEFVPISPNYYDDLLARLDIDTGLVDRLRSLGILYDRS